MGIQQVGHLLGTEDAGDLIAAEFVESSGTSTSERKPRRFTGSESRIGATPGYRAAIASEDEFLIDELRKVGLRLVHVDRTHQHLHPST
jgi:hypothetical protein